MKKKLIKITVIFFLVMLCFTFLSRAANNVTIATADVVEVRQMAIDHTLEVEGMIVRSKMQAIVTEENQLISDMYVREGENIIVGQPLFKVDIDELQRQINGLKIEIDKLNFDIRDAISSRDVTKAKQTRDIRRAEEELAKARQTEEKELIRTAELALEEATVPLVTDSTVEKITLDRDAKVAEMKKLEQLQSAEGIVTASLDGTVVKLELSVGTRTGNSAVVILSDNTANPQFKGQVMSSEEKERQLSNNVGSNVTVVGKDSEGKDYTSENLLITSIMLNQDNGNQLDVLVDLPDNQFNIGSTARMIIASETEDFATCIPISALRGSYNQYFVLVFDERDSILGTGYVARKVSVELLDKNEQYAAIEAAEISSESKIIATSTREISDGSRVKKRKNLVGDASG